MRREFYVYFLLFMVLELQASKHHSRHHLRLRRALNAAIPQWNNPSHQNYRGNQYNSNQRGSSNNQPSLNIPWYNTDPSWYNSKRNFWNGIDPQWNLYKWNLNVDKRTKVKRDCKNDTSNHRHHHHHKHHGRKSPDSIETQEIHNDFDHHGSSYDPYPLHTFHHDGPRKDGPHHFHHHGPSPGYIPFSNNDTSNHRHHHKHHGRKSYDSSESQDLHRDHFDHHGPPSDPYPLHTFHHHGPRKDGPHHFHHHGPPPPPPGDFPFSNNGTIVKGSQTLVPPLNSGTNHSIAKVTYVPAAGDNLANGTIVKGTQPLVPPLNTDTNHSISNASYVPPAGDTLANGTVLSCKYPWIPTYQNGSTGKAIDLIHPWLPCDSTSVEQPGYNGTGTNHSNANATYVPPAGDSLANGTVLSCKYPWIPTYKNGSTGKAIDLIHPWLPCNITSVEQPGYNGIPIDVRFSEIPDLNEGEKYPDP